MAKIINTDGIDEDMLLAAVNNGGVQKPLKEPVSLPETLKDDNKRKRNKQDYETLFIKESTITARLGKTVYVRTEYHDRILKIIRVIGNNEMSLFSYIDNVLTHHFENFQEDITELYDQKHNGIFNKK